jgi:hypothetical protein
MQAIARVLAMMPVSYHLHIHSDSQSSIRAIDAYHDECNERRRMRMSARPLLQLIDHLMSVRTAAGGQTQLTHVAAHTTGTDRDSVGNRLADYQANLSRNCKHGRGTPISLVELPLHECEHHMHMMDDRDGHGMQVINDMRSSANIRLRALMLSHWKSIDNQGAFACDGMIELGRVIMSNGGGHGASPLHQSTLVHVATNSLHYYFPAARGSRLTELVCACGAICTISHLQACNIDRHHAQLHRSIITYLSTTSCSPVWLIKNTGTTMSSMMSSLFPTPHTPHTHGDDIDFTLDDIAHHRTLMMIGAFTTTQSNAAAKALGIVDSNDVRDVMSRIRQLCLEHIGNLYTRMIHRALALAMP